MFPPLKSLPSQLRSFHAIRDPLWPSKPYSFFFFYLLVFKIVQSRTVLTLSWTFLRCCVYLLTSPPPVGGCVLNPKTEWSFRSPPKRSDGRAGLFFPSELSSPPKKPSFFRLFSTRLPPMSSPKRFTTSQGSLKASEDVRTFQTKNNH